jgi:hypothetical protein
MLTASLPFDDENSEKEIARYKHILTIFTLFRQTIYESTPFPDSVWKKFSSEAKVFVDSKQQLLTPLNRFIAQRPK